MKKILYLIAIALGMFGCHNENMASQNKPYESGQLFRIKNNTPYHFTDVYVKIEGNEHNYGYLGPGKTSEYANLPGSYPYIKITSQGKDFIFDIYPYDLPPIPTIPQPDTLITTTCVVSISEDKQDLDIYFTD